MKQLGHLLETWDLTEAEDLTANVLSNFTFRKLQNELTAAHYARMEISFEGDADRRHSAMLEHAKLGGRIEVLRDLLERHIAAISNPTQD